MTGSIGSLFSGIGGLEVGLEMCGLGPVVWQAECDPECLRALEEHWPGATRYHDVREINEGTERVDIICGGFPCQGVSNAGHHAGLLDERSGLWSEFARIIRTLRPSVVFVENVAALLARGLGDVLGDLAALGFDAEWDVFSCSDIGAGHERRRIFILAHTHGLDGKARMGLGHERQEPLLPGNQEALCEVRLAPRCPVPSLADGLPRKLARLPGNAVDPRVAALAWRTLTARIQ